MGTDDNYEYQRVYTGPEVNVHFLEDLLQKEGIATRIRNDFDSGRMAGFGGGTRGQVLLFAHKSRFDEARKIAIETFPEDFKNEE